MNSKRCNNNDDDDDDDNNEALRILCMTLDVSAFILSRQSCTSLYRSTLALLDWRKSR